MKWLAIPAILSMLAMPVVAQEPNLVRLPTALFCGPYDPDNNKEILEEYGEIPFVQGDGEVMSIDPTLSYQGRVRMFLDPEDYSYSVFLDLGEELTCLIVTGQRITPAQAGDGI
jgi:ribosomal protein L21E